MQTEFDRKSDRRYPRKLGGVIDRVIRSIGLSVPYGGWQIVHRWPEIVGENIAQAAQAVRFSDGILYVAVQEDSWRQELAMQRDAILKNIRNHPYGKTVRDIRLIYQERRK